uniref:FBA_2 domain-containing protein n=1 Tax=Caenorhabditis tropicalis TaxID=1561998 RepID=A0A1I7TAJ0_9PELO
MNSKPLTYESSKTVLQYMDPNLRILLSSRIPSIRTAEKAAPLKIEHLEIRSHIIKVNDTYYGCEVYRVDRKYKVPYPISGLTKLNSKWTCDVDEFGTRDYITKAGGLLPGNNGLRELNLFGFLDLENIPTDEGRLQKLKKRLKLETQRYNQLLIYRPKKEVIDDENDSFDFGTFKLSHCNRSDATGLFNKKALGLLKNEDMVKKAIDYMNERIKQMENELLPFENKKRNIRPKFERVKYTGDLHKAEDYLRDFIFAKRQQPVVVNVLTIMEKCCLCKMPRDLKIKLTELELLRATQLKVELVKAITDISSSPLEKVTVYPPSEGEQIDFEFLGRFKLLLFNEMFGWRPEFIHNLQNRLVICHAHAQNFLLSEDFLVLIRNWIENKKPVGTCFIFSIFDPREDFPIRVLKFVKTKYVNAPAEDNYVNIRMRNSAFLRICHEKDKDPRISIRMDVVSVERPHDLTNIKIEPIPYILY